LRSWASVRFSTRQPIQATPVGLLKLVRIVEPLMGANFWPYGIELNCKALEALLQYSHEQGLVSRRLSIDELFHPSTLELIDDSA
jgi:4,5-dihydroxyphthalate decarboxylase